MHVEVLLFLKVIYKIEKFGGVFKIPTLDILVMFAIQLCDNKKKQVAKILFSYRKKIVLSSFVTSVNYSQLVLFIFLVVIILINVIFNP